jgi:hypothetical protein
MSFDAWVVAFGLSRVLIELNLMESPWAYSAMAVTILIDAYFLFNFFSGRKAALKRHSSAICCRNRRARHIGGDYVGSWARLGRCAMSAFRGAPLGHQPDQNPALQRELLTDPRRSVMLSPVQRTS